MELSHASFLFFLASLPALCASLPTQQQEPAQHPVDLQGPEIKLAVSRAQSSWQLAALTGQLQQQQLSGADAVGRALDELSRIQTRLDTVVRDMASLQLAALGGVCPPYQPAQKPEPGPEPGPGLKPEQDTEAEPVPEPKPEPKPECEVLPVPLPVDAAPHAEPALRACARSCLQLRDQPAGPPPDGVYWLRDLPVPAYCDFSHDGGGWTLLLTAATRPGWDVLGALSRSERSPSLTDNYSILRHADTIRDLGSGARFAYRIETQAQLGRRRWGGVWFAPREYSFVHELPTQTYVALVRKFDSWSYKASGIQKRMPWLNTGARGGGDGKAVLTTRGSDRDYGDWWGTMITIETQTAYQHSPWIYPEARESGTVLYWMREESV